MYRKMLYQYAVYFVEMDQNDWAATLTYILCFTPDVNNTTIFSAYIRSIHIRMDNTSQFSLFVRITTFYQNSLFY